MRNIAILLCVLLAAPVTAAAGELSAALGNVSWGDSPEDVLSAQRERLMTTYREEIDGMSDPMEIDRIRSRMDREADSIADSHMYLTDSPTGYEVSIIGTEVEAGEGLSLMTSRIDDLVHYFIFRDDALEKMVIGFDVVSLDYLSFEGFVERLEEIFGAATQTDEQVDEIGRRLLTRAQWTGEETRLRLENRSRLFDAYVLVYSDVSVEDRFVKHEEADSRRSAGRASGVMDRLNRERAEEDREEGGASPSSSTVDAIIGGDTDVQMRLRRDEREAEERERRKEEEEEEARREKEEEEAEEEAARQRERERRRRIQEREDEPRERILE